MNTTSTPKPGGRKPRQAKVPPEKASGSQRSKTASKIVPENNSMITSTSKSQPTPPVNKTPASETRQKAPLKKSSVLRSPVLKLPPGTGLQSSLEQKPHAPSNRVISAVKTEKKVESRYVSCRDTVFFICYYFERFRPRLRRCIHRKLKI